MYLEDPTKPRSREGKVKLSESGTPYQERFYRRLEPEVCGFWQPHTTAIPCRFEVRNGVAYYLGMSEGNALGMNEVDTLFVVRFRIDRKSGLVHFTVIPEELGPLEDDCPAWLLDKASPAPNAKAAQWRERCRQNDILYSQVEQGGRFRVVGKPQRLNVEFVWATELEVPEHPDGCIIAHGVDGLRPDAKPASTVLLSKDFNRDQLYRMLKEGEAVRGEV